MTLRLALIFFLFALTSCSSTAGQRQVVASQGVMPAHVTDLEGVERDLAAAAAAGKSIALIFWQPWCSACREESKVAVQAAMKFKDDLVIVGIVAGPESSISDATVKEAQQELEHNYPSVRDGDLAISNGLGVETVPAFRIFSPSGELVYSGEVPPQEWH